MGLQGILGRLVSQILGRTALQLGDHIDLRFATRVVRTNHLHEPLHAQLAGFGLLEMQHRDLAAGLAEGLDHGLPRLPSAAFVVGGDLGDDLHARFIARDVHGEHRNAGRIGLLNDRDDRLGITGAQHDGADLLDDEVLDLIPLLGDVLVTADHDRLVAVLLALGRDAVSDDLEEGVVEGEQRDADGSLGLRGRGGRMAGIGRLVSASAQECEEASNENAWEVLHERVWCGMEE